MNSRREGSIQCTNGELSDTSRMLVVKPSRRKWKELLTGLRMNAALAFSLGMPCCGLGGRELRRRVEKSPIVSNRSLLRPCMRCFPGPPSNRLISLPNSRRRRIRLEMVPLLTTTTKHTCPILIIISSILIWKLKFTNSQILLY